MHLRQILSLSTLIMLAAASSSDGESPRNYGTEVKIGTLKERMARLSRDANPVHVSKGETAEEKEQRQANARLQADRRLEQRQAQATRDAENRHAAEQARLRMEAQLAKEAAADDQQETAAEAHVRELEQKRTSLENRNRELTRLQLEVDQTLAAGRKVLQFKQTKLDGLIRDVRLLEEQVRAMENPRSGLESEVEHTPTTSDSEHSAPAVDEGFTRVTSSEDEPEDEEEIARYPTRVVSATSEQGGRVDVHSESEHIAPPAYLEHPARTPSLASETLTRRSSTRSSVQRAPTTMRWLADYLKQRGCVCC